MIRKFLLSLSAVLAVSGATAAEVRARGILKVLDKHFEGGSPQFHLVSGNRTFSLDLEDGDDFADFVRKYNGWEAFVTGELGRLPSGMDSLYQISEIDAVRRAPTKPPAPVHVTTEVKGRLHVHVNSNAGPVPFLVQGPRGDVYVLDFECNKAFQQTASEWDEYNVQATGRLTETLIWIPQRNEYVKRFTLDKISSFKRLQNVHIERE